MSATAAALSRSVASGAVSPVEITREALAAARAWQRGTNAFSVLRPEESLAEARALEESLTRGDPPGPLAGVPVAVKDLFDVAGWETTGCCRAYRGRVAVRDAAAVRLLREAGAVVVGKTNQHELAAGATNLVSACGATRNPWDPGRITGGSSGGSAAAVAARVVPVALGSDTGGSVRIPATLCGVTGLKPSHGRVSLEGVMPLAPSLDTVGPLAATVEDAALVLSVLTGEGPGLLAEASGPVRGMTLGVPEGRLAGPLHPVVAEARDRAVRVLEAEGMRRVSLAGDPPYDPDDWIRLVAVEMVRAHGDLLDRPGDLEEPTRRFLGYGRDLPPDEHREARDRTAALGEAFRSWLEDVDVLVVAGTPFPAPRADEREMIVGGATLDVNRGGVSLLTRPVNLAGLAAVALPSGWSEDGLPLGLQLVGRPGREGMLARVGRAFQEATDHHFRAPALPEA